MRRKTTPLLAVGLGAVLALTACGEPEDVEMGDALDLDGQRPGEQGSVTDGTEGTDDAGDGGAGAGPVTPATGECVDLEETADGVYTVGEAGTATVVVRENRLAIEDVSPAAGWEYSVDTEDDDEVEIEFRRGDDELDLEVEIHDGRVTVEICADDG